jgi:hypothetical protein
MPGRDAGSAQKTEYSALTRAHNASNIYRLHAIAAAQAWSRAALRHTSLSEQALIALMQASVTETFAALTRLNQVVPAEPRAAQQNPLLQKPFVQSLLIRQRSPGLQRLQKGSSPPQSMPVSVPSRTPLPQEMQMPSKQLLLKQSEA